MKTVSHDDDRNGLFSHFQGLTENNKFVYSSNIWLNGFSDYY